MHLCRLNMHLSRPHWLWAKMNGRKEACDASQAWWKRKHERALQMLNEVCFDHLIKWREKQFDAAVLRVAVAFWAATQDPAQDNNGGKIGCQNRHENRYWKLSSSKGLTWTSWRIRKVIFGKNDSKCLLWLKKVILESNSTRKPSEALHTAKPGHEKHMRGLIPSNTGINNFHRKMNVKAAELGFSCMPQTNTWYWGDNTGNTQRNGVHRYVKSVYYELINGAHKLRARSVHSRPYGWLSARFLSTECSHFVWSQGLRTPAKISKRDRRTSNNMNQTHNLHVSAIGVYATESEIMPLFEQLVEFPVEIEEKKYIGLIVDNKS